MQAQWRNPETGPLEFVQSLHGSALEVGISLVAALENYQHSYGAIRVPDAPRPYMSGAQLINPVNRCG